MLGIKLHFAGLSEKSPIVTLRLGAGKAPAGSRICGEWRLEARHSLWRFGTEVSERFVVGPGVIVSDVPFSDGFGREVIFFGPAGFDRLVPE
jgi:hypothetical protein